MGIFRNKVVGIGWAKTGTTTLKVCLEKLGYRHCSQRLDLVSEMRSKSMWKIWFQDVMYSSFEDWPWILLYRDLDEWFPDSKFILTVRNSTRWLRSYRNLLKNSVADEGINEIRSFLYGLDLPNVDDQELISRYERHNREVQAYFADRPDQLLIVDWEKGDGWGELCSFLNRPIPEEPFPHANKGEYS